MPQENFLQELVHHFHLPFTSPVLVFCLILFIILLAPLLTGRLKLPGITGLIIAGIVVGPHGFHLLEQNSAVTLFSTIGLLYIMFIAGLELDMSEFVRNRHKSIAFGAFTFFIPLCIGFPVCLFLLKYSWTASLLTASMFATHTLVAYPIVHKFNIGKNEAVATTVGGTILTDTAVLLLLAILVGSADGALNLQFWMKMGLSLAVFFAAIVFGIPALARWFFQRVKGEKNAHYVFVMAMVFLSALLAEMAGVEPIIGAFLAGLTLNRFIPHTSALMNRLEFVGNALFIPFFLISVGMLVDVRVLMKGETALIVAGTLTIVALTGKYLAAWTTRVLFRYNRSQGNLIFGLSSGHAAATLAVILVGFRAGILDENILNGTILLILVTCIVASLVTEKAARQLAHKEDMAIVREAAETVVEQILVPIANYHSLEPLIDLATTIKDPKSHNPVTLLTVVENNDEADQRLILSRKKLSEFVKYGSASETLIHPMVTIENNIVEGITRVARELTADILLMGWPEKKASILDRIFGQKTDRLIEDTINHIFICRIMRPLNTHAQLVLLCPPYSERESGFMKWFTKINLMAKELGLNVCCYCNAITQRAIQRLLQEQKIATRYLFEPIHDWEEFQIRLGKIKLADLIVVISARKSNQHYIHQLDNIPQRLSRHFPQNSAIIIYPPVLQAELELQHYDDAETEPAKTNHALLLRLRNMLRLPKAKLGA